MRIAKVEAFAVKISRNDNLAKPNSSPYTIPKGRNTIKSNMHETLVVRISTDDGLTGYGEGQSPVSPETTGTIVANLCSPLMLGKDPFDVEQIWQLLYNAMRERGHITGFYLDAIAACDIALWDLKGKATGKPVHKLLGGQFREQIPLYAGCPGRNIKTVIDQAEKLISAGYKGLKLSPASDRKETLAIVSAVRDHIGSDIAIMVDLHSDFDVTESIKLGRDLELLDIYWLEAPTVPDDLPGHVAITAALNMFVANGEWYRTRYQMREALEKRICDVLMPDIGRTGLSEGKRIAVLADTYNIPISPHVGGGGLLAIAATIQFSAAIPNFLIMEHNHSSYSKWCQLALDPPLPSQGKFPVTDKPGLGILIDDTILENFTLVS